MSDPEMPDIGTAVVAMLAFGFIAVVSMVVILLLFP